MKPDIDQLGRQGATMVALGIWVVGAMGCTKSLPPSTRDLTGADLVQRGKAVYAANCTACHNGDPKKVGSLGPDIAGSSRELLEARVLRAEYPPGYSPKRSSRLMVALPQMQAEISSLHAYLNEVKGD